MSKRIRRDRRCIWVDSEETAKNIERYCVDNGLVEDSFARAYTTCHAMDLGTRFDPKWAVIFYCTLNQWNRIEEQYDLSRLNSYKYTYEYELSLSK